MTKKELIEKVSSISSLDSKSVQAVLSAYQKVLVSALKKDKEFSLLDLGKMKVVHKKARTGINPRTQKSITVPERDAPKLACSKKLKNFISNSEGVKEADFKF